MGLGRETQRFSPQSPDRASCRLLPWHAPQHPPGPVRLPRSTADPENVYMIAFIVFMRHKYRRVSKCHFFLPPIFIIKHTYYILNLDSAQSRSVIGKLLFFVEYSAFPIPSMMSLTDTPGFRQRTRFCVACFHWIACWGQQLIHATQCPQRFRNSGCCIPLPCILTWEANAHSSFPP